MKKELNFDKLVIETANIIDIEWNNMQVFEDISKKIVTNILSTVSPQEIRCDKCIHCSNDIDIPDMLLCNNSEDLVQVYTHEGAQINVEPDFYCKGFKPKPPVSR